MICGFGISRIIGSNELALLTEVCGTIPVSPEDCLIFGVPVVAYPTPLNSNQL